MISIMISIITSTSTHGISVHAPCSIGCHIGAGAHVRARGLGRGVVTCWSQVSVLCKNLAGEVFTIAIFDSESTFYQ
ncbi:hypothetical protein T492DRAFT_1035137 [Pavlovales sp. CCMP2436]|nr:hypothetical protein T492DRAFT_1035137 [Pavlovales sp. CCMP2436]